MDAFDNPNALPKIKKLLRTTEILLILVYLTSAIIRPPPAFKLVGEFSRRLAVVVVSPFFIFLIGNVIVLALLCKSRPHLLLIHNEDIIDGLISSDFDFRRDFVGNLDGEQPALFSTSGHSCEKNVFQETETTCKKKNIKSAVTAFNHSVHDDCRPEEDKCCCNNCGGCGRLAAAEGGGQVEGLNNEEFKRAIEAFISRQINFRRQEQLVICV